MATFGLLCWNVHKQNDSAKFARVFDQITGSYSCDILCFQEYRMHQASGQKMPFSRVFAPNLLGRKSAFGTMTQSRFALQRHCIYPAAHKELYCTTSKNALLTSYTLKNKTLHVINLHAINFVLTSAYQKQLTQLEGIIQKLQDPLIICGDFNSWNSGRTKLLDAFAHKHGLLVAKPDNRHFVKTWMQKPIDYILYRGLGLQQCNAINARVSDHNPLYGEFSFE
ncbi:MAG: endonuclease/exonuclease/phosphatase family protein [Campylobacterota bacterium]